MAILKYRLRRKNTEGEYDVLHLETQASEVLRYTGAGAANGTVESALNALETNSANKVSSPTAGNFASLTNTGDLADSGKKASDFANASHTHDLTDLASETIKEKVLVTDANGKLAAGGATATEVGYLNGVKSGIQGQLDNKLETSLKGAKGGLAELDSDGHVPSTQLPSYVDDVLEFANKEALPAEGESGKIYVTKDTNLTYRWSGTAYVEISASLALGETSSTAYPGDKGKIAYDHSQNAKVHVPVAETAGKVLKSVVDGQAVWSDEATLSKGDTEGSGNAVTEVAVNGHTVTLTKGKTFIEAVPNKAGELVTLTTDGQVAASGKTLSSYVEVKEGYNLSKNDFTDTLKTKLDGITIGATKTEASENNGKIKINDTEVTVYTEPTDVIHGTNGADTAIANGDKLAFIDVSDDNKLARTAATFDGTTTTKALTPKGTFETFLQAGDIADKADKSATVSTVAYDAGAKKITKTINGTTTDVVTVDTLENDMATMSPANAEAAGKKGLVPAPAAGDQDKYLTGAGTWATPYTHPNYTARAEGFYKVTVDSTGHVSNATAVAASDITALGFVEASFAASEPTGQQTNGLWFETIT